MELAIAVVALVLALLALGDAVLRRRSTSLERRRRAAASQPADLELLREEVDLLRADAAETFRHLAAVRYDAFGDMGGQMSWSLALLDDVGSGVVLTSIHGRTDSRTYVKSVAGWSSEQQLSPEETEAVTLARAGARERHPR